MRSSSSRLFSRFLLSSAFGHGRQLEQKPIATFELRRFHAVAENERVKRDASWSSRSCPGDSFHPRPFATSAQKRAAQQQKRDGEDGKKALINPETEARKPIIAASLPSLIRTDFAMDSFSTQELIVPSGYEITTTTKGETTQQAYVDYKQLYDPQVHLPSAPQDWSDYEPATPLWEELAAQIGVMGRPITVAEFMQHALLHPEYGYYSQPMRDAAEDDNNDDIFNDSDDLFGDDDAKKDNPIFGARGDFVTAPEICQVFGESIQVWMVTQWEAMGKPRAVQWVEFGPGRGTLIADMVRFVLTHNQNNETANNKLQEYGQALQVIHLIEPSNPLRAKQEASLMDVELVNWKFHNNNDNTTSEEVTTNETKPTIHVHWYDSFGALSAMIMRSKQKTMGRSVTPESKNDTSDISSMPIFVVCQEFFDALPVHAFEMTDDGWRERMVDMAIRDELLEDEEENDSPNPAVTSNPLQGQKRPRLRIVLAPVVTPALKTLLHVDENGRMQGAPTTAEPGHVIEVCPGGIVLMQDIAALLEQQSGAALIVDYGEKGTTDSLRGFWKHKQTHFLSLPGQCDVTADVDFTALKRAVNYVRPSRLQQQQQVSSNEENDTTDSATANDSHPGPVRQSIKAYGPIPQGKFLVSMGAKQRVIQCIESDSTTDEQAEELVYALERLVAPDQMGVRYKVLAVAAERHSSDGTFTIPPAGF